MERQARRFLHLDFLRVIAMAAVINIHASAHLVLDQNQESMAWWWIGNVFDGLSRWCVPVFIIISGRLLLQVRESEVSENSERIWSFLRKRLRKVAIPLVAWSVIYYVLTTVHRSGPGALSAVEFVRRFLGDNVEYHLWFLYVILGIYLLVPMLRNYVARASNKNLLYIISVLFIVYNVSQAASQLFGVPLSKGVSQAGVYIGYFLLGHYLGRVTFGAKARRRLYAIALLCAVITISGTYLLNVHSPNSFNEFFYNDPNITTVFESIAVFVFARTWMERFDSQSRMAKAVIRGSQLSLGVYLIHPLFLTVIPREEFLQFLFGSAPLRPLVGVPLTDVIVLVLSAVTIWIMKKIPFVWAIVP